MSFADKQEAGRHNGDSLLDVRAMPHLISLIEAQEGYAAAQQLHAEDIGDLQAKIDELNAEKEGLLQAREAESDARHKEIGNHAHQLSQLALRDTSTAFGDHRSMHLIYASVVKGINADGQSNLFDASTVDIMDTTARSMIEVDAVLRKKGPQPIVVCEDHGHGWLHIMSGKTKWKGRIRSTTKGKEQTVGLYGRITQTHQALQMPVQPGSMSGHQLQTNDTGRLLEWNPYGPHTLKNMFDFMLPAGRLYKSREIGSYDTEDSTVSVHGELGPGSMSGPRLFFAIGNLSVNQFFDRIIKKNDKLEPHAEALRSQALDGKKIPDEALSF